MENCSKIPLPCPNSCGDTISREMVNEFHCSLSDVIKDRSINSSQGFNLAGRAVGCLSWQSCYKKFEKDLPNLKTSKRVNKYYKLYVSYGGNKSVKSIWSWSLRRCAEYMYMTEVTAKKNTGINVENVGLIGNRNLNFRTLFFCPEGQSVGSRENATRRALSASA